MDERAREIEAFKSEIDLRVYAASLGYELDRRASGPNSPVMVDGDGNKIVIAKGRDGHWIYFSVRDERDCGSIIDFAQRRGVGSLGEVRKTLRPFIGTAGAPPPSRTKPTDFPELTPIERDIVGVRARYEDMQPLLGFHRYLVEERRIPAALLRDARFRGRVRVDDRGNAVFPHFNREGLCGFELKNAGFTGFAKGGAKGLWASSVRSNDRTLIVAEAAVDALSYAVLHGHARARFVSLAGQVSPEQIELVRAATEKLPTGVVVLAFDNDQAGDELVAKFSGVFEQVGRPELTLRVHRPEAREADWNDVVCSRPGSAPPPPELGR